MVMANSTTIPAQVTKSAKTFFCANLYSSWHHRSWKTTPLMRRSRKMAERSMARASLELQHGEWTRLKERAASYTL